ncbi:MAG: hypothetical protein AAB554_03325 [Patescibacteria group bacterium]
MQDFVPEDIRGLIASIEAKQDADFQARKRAEEAEMARLRRIEDLRETRRDELVAACRTIHDWIESFEATAGPPLWRLEGSGVVIFSAKFHRGEPAPDDRRATAQLRVGPPGKPAMGRLVYEEIYAMVPAASVTKIPLLIATHLWQKLHPDFVMQCAAQLSGPDAWKDVRIALERMTQAGLARR